MSTIKFPGQPTSSDQILSSITKMQKADADWRHGRLFSLIYHAESELEEVTKAAYMSSFSLNALGHEAFPSLARMEADIIGMTADLLGQPGAPGSLTSGSSESNFLALKTARDRMREVMPQVKEPEVIVPWSGHPSLSKASGYLGLKVVRAALDSEQRADLVSVKKSITPNTILVVGSAPTWPHGVVDPIVEMAELASRKGVMMHVDACVGGFVLPFAKRLGRPVPEFDLSVDGVTSVSADVHKFGYSSNLRVPAVRLQGLDRRRLRGIHRARVAAGRSGGGGVGDHPLPRAARLPRADQASPGCHAGFHGRGQRGRRLLRRGQSAIQPIRLRLAGPGHQGRIRRAGRGRLASPAARKPTQLASSHAYPEP